ncbi:hypothetical protein Q670_01960 [Alcanivorax sp. P2S70]|nr:hypothetical protein Q670_01960 [Alcanivorax sp. P2S70]
MVSPVGQQSPLIWGQAWHERHGLMLQELLNQVLRVQHDPETRRSRWALGASGQSERLGWQGVIQRLSLLQAPNCR